ncbi:CPBP family intramembrane glutamic endopeptidase [Nitrosomonas marina]|uniref:CAAX prenyl protease 2/Lysostaphin resistance protein A-like domain-containing protein n=1 Tax=Nitrosomonas marina TaxID=917 RepID=A0A1H8B334_9PROT|nr:CPBP family intramembrane glutamic endopeptidase [Nitrosomonas marina]SEM77301.1 hypothetical protein SAMN05216325_10279 [Nitrosomonas marina]
MRRFFLTVYKTLVSTEKNSYRSLKDNISQFDYKVMLICLTTALVLTCTHYFGDFKFLVSILLNLGFNDLAIKLQRLMLMHPDSGFFQALYWASVIVFFYLALPAICIKWIFRENFTEYGAGFEGALRYYRLYIWMLIVMIPLVYYFSATESFIKMYPFYKVSPGDSLFPKFFVWELFYFLQFVALEFFFRGFMLHGTKHRFGFYSIFFMMVPYCMIHFGKPMPETIAAIIAGVILGYMSLKSRNIWLGVFVHCSVALMMDVSALIRQGVFGSQAVSV